MRRQHSTSPSTSSHCSAPVREAVAALAAASSTSPQDSSNPTATPTQRACRPACPPACHCATAHSKAHRPRLNSVACWLRWRRLPMAWPGVEGCTHGAAPGSPTKYCASPMPAATSAASTSATLQ